MSVAPHGTADAIIVGFGPVGEVLSILLAQRGHRVIVLERYDKPYGLPRAVHFDDETARILAEVGIGAAFGSISEPGTQYDWQNAAGETLLHFDHTAPGPSGWPQATMFHQPALEQVLAERAAQLPTLEVIRDQTVDRVIHDGDCVLVETRGPQGESVFSAPWVIGCDGANSTIRQQMAVAQRDEGFCHDWLICDVILDETRVFQPSNLQICDPHRPCTQVSGGPGRRRWEFMRLPGETVEHLLDLTVIWQLLAGFDVTPDNARLERAVVYTFQARWAEDWRVNRMLLAGDAAHLMPPFAGQGMCSGLRDAHNLAWKLDLVLRRVADPALLDTYVEERSAHVRHAMGMSIELGRVICLLDSEAAAARDAAMTALNGDPAKVLPPLPPPTLSSGVMASGGGDLMPQGSVEVDGATGRFDDLMGTCGFLLVKGDELPVIGDSRQRFIEEAEVQMVAVAQFDVDDFYELLLGELGAAAVLVRPDNWIFGIVATLADVPLLIDAYCSALTQGTAALRSAAGS